MSYPRIESEQTAKAIYARMKRAKFWNDLFPTPELQIEAWNYLIRSFVYEYDDPDLQMASGENDNTIRATLTRNAGHVTVIERDKNTGDVKVIFNHVGLEAQKDEIIATVGDIAHNYTCQDTLLPDQAHFFELSSRGVLNPDRDYTFDDGKIASSDWERRIVEEHHELPIRIGYRLYEESKMKQQVKTLEFLLATHPELYE